MVTNNRNNSCIVARGVYTLVRTQLKHKLGSLGLLHHPSPLVPPSNGGPSPSWVSEMFPPAATATLYSQFSLQLQLPLHVS
jgi:hypothetical protein